ncbi:hypothetical protein ACIOD1_32705 [Streptomyces sp. NPDC088097]|uniref:hypothetical protein n=1 Tax=Streptomyces sp. NPDC088097 TaxID=3365823 RepID=UPI00382E2089
MLLVHTSGPDVLRNLGRPALAFISVLMLASCTSGGSETKAADPCGISPTSQEGELVRSVLGTEDFSTKAYGPTSSLVDKAERALRVMGPEKDTFYTNVCGYGTEDERRDARVIFLAGWSLRTSAVPSAPNDASYAWNGARGVTNESRSSLLVPCDMPGELKTQSQKVWLTADMTYTFGPTRPDVNQAVKDRRMTFAYLMARRVTEALGCENEPLSKPPVVSPVPTP